MRTLPLVVWAPIAAALSVLVLGLSGLLTGMPWLFASLGPTIAIQAATPRQPIARPWNVVVGHGVAVVAALVSLYVTGAIHAPPFAVHQPLVIARVLAAALAVGLGLMLEFWLKANHPPAASTALLIALGIILPTPRGLAIVVLGIVLVAILGEVVRRLRLAQASRGEN